MGRLEVAFASLPAGVQPDWKAARAAIDDLSLETLGELIDNAYVPGADQATADALSVARRVLREDLDAFEGVALDGFHPSMTRLHPADITIIIGEKDEQPFDAREETLYDILDRLRWSGILVHGGFHDNR
jgi:hypothetical protein